MKKNIIMAMIAVIVSMNGMCASYMTMGDNDSLRIRPNRLNGYSTYPVDMFLDAYADYFNVGISYPEGLRPKMMYNLRGIESGDGLAVTFTMYDGSEASFMPTLNVGETYQSVSASLSATGWWDYNMDGVLEPYGSVKWEPGCHEEVFVFNFWVSDSFRKGYVTFDGVFNSGMDGRGPILSNVQFYKKVWCWVGYMKGDINGDERVNVTDVTLLDGYLIDGSLELDEFQLEAADVNCDGEINITDVTRLIARIINQ